MYLMMHFNIGIMQTISIFCKSEWYIIWINIT